MARGATKLEQLRVVSVEKWEDDEYYYEKQVYNRGGYNIDRHPKNPEKPKEVIMQEVGVLLLRAWHNAVLAGRIDLTKKKRSDFIVPPAWMDDDYNEEDEETNAGTVI